MSSGAARARDRTLSTGSARASSDPLSSNGSQRSHSGRNKRSRRDVPKAKRNASSKSENRRDKLLSALCPHSPSSIDMKCPSEPPFLNFPHLISEHPPEKPFVAVGKPEVINVVHVKSPSSFYVHRDQDKTVLEDLQKFLETCPERNSPPPDVVAIGQMFICKFLVDDKWYRVVVKDCTAMLNPPESCEAIVDIFYVDYGNSDRVPLSSLKPLPAELSEVPPFALHCSIFDLHPRGNVWSDEAYRTFCKMVNGVRVHMQVMSFKNDTYYIDLCAIPGIKNRNFPVSMRDAFVFMNFGCMEDENRINIRQCSPHFDSEYLEEEPLSKGEHFLVVLSHIESPSQFYAQRRGAHAESLLKVLDEMTHYYKDNNDMVYDPGMGMPCAAQFSVDKSWYRARVIGIPRVSCVEVFYVDYGNHEEVPYTSIRKLPEKFMRIPPKAIECALVDVMPLGGNKWPKTASEYFLATTKDKELRLFVEDVSKPCTKVILYEEKENVDVCLNALMVRDGHALSIGVGASLVEYFKVEAPLPDIAAAIPVPAETEIIPTRKCNRKRGKRDPSGVGLLDSNELFTVEASKSSTINDKTNGPPFGVPITVVSMKSPNCLYVSLCSREEEIANLVQEMQIHYSGLPCSETTWKEGDKCAVWSEKYSKWQRATITALREIDADVFYKDIALPDTVPIQNLQVLHEKFANIHDGAVKCHMVGIRAAGGEKWSSVACEMLSEFVHKTYSELFITKKGEIENRSLPVELWAKVTVTPGPLEPSKINWVSINQSLMDNGMAIPTKMPDNMEIMKSDCQSVEEISDSNSGVFTENEGTMITFRSNDDLSSSGDENEDSDGRTELILCPENPKRQWLPVVPLKKQCFSALITYIDGDGNLWLHDIEDDETLAIIKSANTEVFGQSKPKPQDMYWFEGQICLAQFFADKCWYRGKIMQVKENDTYEVLFVDYGNTEECAVDMLRKDVILTHIPIQCRGVMLDEIRPASLCGKWKTEHLDFLQLTLDGCICQVTVVSSLNDKIPKVSIKMPGNIDVAELLVNMHYAIYSSNVTGELDFEDIIIEEVQDITDQEVKENLREEKDEVQVDKTEASKKTECVVISSEVKCDKSIGFTSEKTETAKNANDKIMENVNKKGSMHTHEKSNDINTANRTYLPKDTNIVDITGELQTLGKDTCGVNSANNDIENQTSVDEKVTGMRDVTNKIDVTNVDDVTNKVPNSNNKVLTIVHHVQGIKGEMSTTSGESEMKIQSNSASPDVCSNVKECFNEAVEKEDATYKNETFDKNLSFKKINLDNWDTLPVQVSILLDNLTEIVMVPEKNGNEEILFRDGFDVMTLEMQQEAASHPIIDFPYIGLPCCAQYSEDEKYYRAIILEIDECNNKALIEYVDYGNEEWLELKSIHHIKSTWLDIPVQGIKSHLWKIKIAEEFDKAIVLKNMTDVLFDRSLTAKIKERNPLAVELYVKDTENLVYKPLIDAGFIKNIQEI